MSWGQVASSFFREDRPPNPFGKRILVTYERNPARSTTRTPEPQSDSSEKPPIRKSQEEFVDDMAGPSMDKSEYEQRKGQGQTAASVSDADDAQAPGQR